MWQLTEALVGTQLTSIKKHHTFLTKCDYIFVGWDLVYLQDSNIMGHACVSSGYLCRIMGQDKEAVILKHADPFFNKWKKVLENIQPYHFPLLPYRHCINFLSRFWRGMKGYCPMRLRGLRLTWLILRGQNKFGGHTHQLACQTSAPNR